MNADYVWIKIERHLIEYGFDDVEIILKECKKNAPRSLLNTKIKKAIKEAFKVMGFHDSSIYPLAEGTGPALYYTFPPLNMVTAFSESLGLPPHNVHAANEYITIKEFNTSTKMAATLWVYGMQ